MVATRQTTVEQFQTLSLDGIWELIDGELFEMSPESGRSGWLAAVIATALANHAHPNRLGWVFSGQTGFVLFSDRDTVRVPDAAFVVIDRLAAPPATFVPLAPDLAVEVLSPSDRMADALGKVAMYLQAGVRLVWLFDPGSQTVSVFRPDAVPLTLNRDDTLDGGDVLPEFRLPIAAIFG